MINNNHKVNDNNHNQRMTALKMKATTTTTTTTATMVGKGEQGPRYVLYQCFYIYSTNFILQYYYLTKEWAI